MNGATDPSSLRLRRLALRVQMPGPVGTRLDDDTRQLVADGLGALCLFGANASAGRDPLLAMVAAIHAAAGNGDEDLRTLVSVDEEGGDVTRLHATTGSPVPGSALLGAADDPAWTEQVGAEIGAELASLGIDLVLGPVADVNSQPDNPVIGVRSPGGDPDRVAAHATAWLRGVQSHGVAACAKHFPGHGDTRADSHLALPVLDADQVTLHGRELVPFRAAVDAGVQAVMTGHLVVPVLDPQHPASLSAATYSLLRDDLGFTGLAVTDALDMAGARQGRTIPEAAVRALAAGADLLCLGPESGVPLVREVQDALVTAVATGRLPERRLAEAASGVDRLARAPRSVARPCLPEAEQVAGHARRVRRVLEVHGSLPPLDDALIVLVDTAPSIAVGAVPWGLPARLVVDPEDRFAADAVLVAASGRPVVLQVRDAHRQPAVAALVATVAAATSTVVVEWGWPGAAPEPLTRVCAYGSSAPAHRAVAELLGEHGLVVGPAAS